MGRGKEKRERGGMRGIAERREEEGEEAERRGSRKERTKQRHKMRK